MADIDEPVFEREPEYASPTPADLLARFNGHVITPQLFPPMEAPVAEAISITPAPSKKVLFGKLFGALATIAGVAHLMLPAGLPDTLLKGAEILFGLLSSIGS